MECKELPQLKEINMPYYVRIYDVIYELIRDGQLKEGDTLPGENLLATYWNVSRSTVRMAVRKLEEDGFIYKMQGKKTTVTGQLARNGSGLQFVANPCLVNCIAPITRVEHTINVQNGGKLVGDLLGYDKKVFTAVAVDFSYYVGEEHVASSVSIIPILKLEEEGISIEEEEKIREFGLTQLYGLAKWSRLTISAMEWNEDETDIPPGQILIVMEEILYEDETPLTYHKYRMDSNWYRFSLDRRM